MTANGCHATSTPAPSDARAAWEPTRWYRVLDKTGQIWAESSDEHEVREAARRIGQPVERLWKQTNTEWRIAAAANTEARCRHQWRILVGGRRCDLCGEQQACRAGEEKTAFKED